MWLITALLVILVFLLLVVIMDTSMKLALMITTLYNYDSKKLFIPACLSVIVWALLILACFNTINKSLDNNPDIKRRLSPNQRYMVSGDIVDVNQNLFANKIRDNSIVIIHWTGNN